MQSIHLISLGYTDQKPGWKFGEVWFTQPEISNLVNLVVDQQDKNPNNWFLFLNSSFDLPGDQIIHELTKQKVDLWHTGLKLGTNGLPGLIDFVAPTWTFNRDPDPAIETTSWRVSLQSCLVRAELIQQLGFLDDGFQSLAGAALEWGLRCIQHGALLRHHPDLLPPGFKAQPQENIPFSDQLRLIHLRYGLKWATWAAMRAILSGYAPLQQALPALAQLRRQAPPSRTPIYQTPGMRLPSIRSPGMQAPAEMPLGNEKSRISVLIPTLERYPYLRTLLRQLGEQSCPPHEILVIDQTPEDQRQIELYQEFGNLPLRVFFQEQPGQCSSRNLGLQAARGDYILFLDDDDEIPSDLLEKHLQHLESSAADASCGAADEVGAGPLPPAFTYRRASDVFPTNNTLLRKSALLKSGLFDLAYEHGARTDGDLGMRLYLGGAKMIYEPGIRVLHHHAPRGGLRAHKARQVTYASSRKSLLQRRLPSVTELYLVKRYFNQRQVKEQLWLSVLGTFSLHQDGLRRGLKAFFSFLLLPHTLWVLQRRLALACHMLEKYPQIPQIYQEDL